MKTEVLALDRLLAARCKPAKGDALSPKAAARQAAVLGKAWSLDKKHRAISRLYKFADFHETIEFVNAVAWMIHGEDHHPDLSVGYDRCEVVFSTHSVGGLSINDFVCAAKCDAIRAIRSSGSKP